MEISKNLSYEEHIFMSRKQYSKELKLELVKKHLEDGISYWKLGKEYGIEASIIRRWGHKYETFGEDGLEKQNADLCNYSAEFKKKIVLEYLGGNINKYGCSYGQVYAWVRKYKDKGIEGLYDRRGKNKAISQLSDIEKLKAENRLLKAQTQQQQMEIDFLKKLDEIERR